MRKDELRKTLYRIDGKGYKAYKDIEGAYDFDDFTLSIDHAQADPFIMPRLFDIAGTINRMRSLRAK